MPSKAGLDNHSPSSKGNNGEAVPPKPAADYEETLPSTSMEDALTAKIVIPPSGASLKPDVMIEMQTCDAAINIALVDSDLNLPPFVVTEMIPPKPAGCEVAHQQAGCDEKYVHVPDDDDEMAKIDGQNWPNENTAPRTCVEETGGPSGVHSVISAMLVAVFGAIWTSTTNTPMSVMMVAFSAACTSSTNTPKDHFPYPHWSVANRREESARWPARAAGWLLVVGIMTITDDGTMAKVTPRLGDVEAASTLAGISKLDDFSASTSIVEGTATSITPPSVASLKPDNVLIGIQTCDTPVNIEIMDSDENSPPFVITEVVLPTKPADCETGLPHEGEDRPSTIYNGQPVQRTKVDVAALGMRRNDEDEPDVPTIGSFQESIGTCLEVADQQARCNEKKNADFPGDDEEMAKVDGKKWPTETTTPLTGVEEAEGPSVIYLMISATMVAVFGAIWTSTMNTPMSAMMVAFSAACTSSTNTPKYHCTYPHCCAPVANRREESARWPTRAAGWLLVVVIMTINNDGAMAKVTPRLGDVEAARTLAGINKLNDLSASTSIAEETAEIIIPPSVASIQSDDVLIGDQTDTVVKTELKGSDENSPPFVATKVVLPTTAAESWLPDKEEDQTKFMGNNPLGVRTKVVAASGMRRNDKEPTIGSYQKGVEA